MKRVLKWVGLFVVVALLGVGGYAAMLAHQFDESVAKVYDIPLPAITRSTDPAILERGKHLAESMGGCALSDCHGPQMTGGKVIELGPVGAVSAPNITGGGRGGKYSDQELARLIQHGIKRDGRTVLFMPANETAWFPDEDVAAIISYLRTVPADPRPDGPFQIGIFGKVLDRKGSFALDIARIIDHQHRPTVPTPAPTAQYGAFIGRMCQGCHGEHLSGGPIPGAPPSLPIPLNLTPHETGLKGWTYEDFEKVLATGVRKKDGRKLDPFMPFEALSKLNDVEKHALWAYLAAQPPVAQGNR